MTRRATLLVAVAVALLGLAVGIAIDVIDDGESAEADAGGAAEGGVIPDRPCVLAVTVLDPEAVGGGVFHIATVGPDGGEPTLISDDDVVTDPDISPDGERIVYVHAIGDYESSGPDQTEVWTMGIDGADPTPLLVDGAFNEDPTWSPDGRTVALARSLESGRPEIVYVAAGGSEPAVVVPATGDAETWTSVDALTWSPDGERLAYLWRSEGMAFGLTEVRTVAVDGGEVRTLAEIPYGRTIDWSPDGSSLLVARWDGPTEGLHLVDPETGAVQDLPRGAALARWAPDGTHAYAIVKSPEAGPENGEVWTLVDIPVPPGPGLTETVILDDVNSPAYGMAVGPTC